MQGGKLAVRCASSPCSSPDCGKCHAALLLAYEPADVVFPLCFIALLHSQKTRMFVVKAAVDSVWSSAICRLNCRSLRFAFVPLYLAVGRIEVLLHHLGFIILDGQHPAFIIEILYVQVVPPAVAVKGNRPFQPDSAL
jgi:hypothetical protein